MAIPLCGTFHYVAVIPDGFRPGESVVPAQDASGPPDVRGRSSYQLGDEPLLGFDPTLSIRDGRLVITASGPQGARIAAASFRVVAELMKTLRRDDVLRLVRVGSGDVGLAILREDRLSGGGRGGERRPARRRRLRPARSRRRAMPTA